MILKNFCVELCVRFMYIDPLGRRAIENGFVHGVGVRLVGWVGLSFCPFVLVSYDKTFLWLVVALLPVSGDVLTYLLTEPVNKCLLSCPNMAHTSQNGTLAPLWERQPHSLTVCTCDVQYQ